ncbi:MAG: site-specific integrase [Acidobacteria bacterium]|nr:site-specific integrase [Acidobacteriota bacterium]
MARTVKSVDLGSKAARARLPRHTEPGQEPHWHFLDRGLSLGYWRGARGGIWRVRAYHEGKYRKGVLGLADDVLDADGKKVLSFSQAQAQAREWFLQVDRAPRSAPTPRRVGHTVRDALAAYLKAYEDGETKDGGRALAATRSIINAHILPDLGELRLAELTPVRLKAWHRRLARLAPRVRSKHGQAIKTRDAKDDPESQRKRRATANRILNTLKAALNWAWREEHMISTDEGWRSVTPHRKVDVPIIRFLGDDETIRLVNATPADFRPMVQAALFTGCRYGELCAARVSDFDEDAGMLTVPKSKSGAARHVTLTAEATKFFIRATVNKQDGELIFTRPDGRGWRKSEQQRPLAEACKSAKIQPAISFHILRHCHGSRLARNGVPMEVIAKQLGHADSKITGRHYAHLSPSYVSETIRAKTPSLGIADTDNVESLRLAKGQSRG